LVHASPLIVFEPLNNRLHSSTEET